MMFLMLALLGLALAEVANVGTGSGAGCDCDVNVCGCCAWAEWDNEFGYMGIGLCADVRIDWDTLSIILEVTINGEPIVHEQFGFGVEPKVCFDFLDTEICVDINDIELSPEGFFGCIDMTISALRQPIELGCFEIPFTSE